ncbi:MAG: hypothetical protein M1831_002493 [Alyxoria varia]|nr:MAG: hypothetical protein M1831_002493 [Alyxoria varia]
MSVATTATRGGAGVTATPANSGGGLFGKSAVGSTNNNAGKTEGTNVGNNNANRRASQEQGGLFGSLSNLKRDSTDVNKTARKSSMGEQRPQPGMIGQMFNNITKNGDHK